ncbi:MAG: dTDP-4-dehydrorhamnose reductase [Verrucomicrobia bacterium]|nr:dTDP-4-dehydrorhamnose reductase [Verrucomicrobiota bacterium]
MQHIAIIGARGALGSDLMKVFRHGWQVTGFDLPELDVTNLNQLRRQLAAARPDVVINTAAYNLVREAETNRDAAFAVNDAGAANVANVARDLGAVCVHYGTDYVFDGETDHPYAETDAPRPLNVYGASKLAGEQRVLAASPRHLVLRTTGLYGETPTLTKGANFVQIVWKMARGKQEIALSDRETCSPTWTLELARQTRVLLEAGADGLFHAVQEGTCTWREFAQAILDIGGNAVVVKPKPSEADDTLKRPRYTALANARLHALDLNRMSHWRTALETFLKSEGGRQLRERTLG